MKRIVTLYAHDGSVIRQWNVAPTPIYTSKAGTLQFHALLENGDWAETAVSGTYVLENVLPPLKSAKDV